MDELEKAMKDGCPPEVAVRSKFVGAMDRHWKNLGQIRVPREYPYWYTISCGCQLPSLKDWLSPNPEPPKWSTAVNLTSIDFRGWYEGECETCKTLYCARLLVDGDALI